MRQVIICDFDETITDRDTISILAELPYVAKPDFEPRWAHFSDTYMRDYRKFLENQTWPGCEDKVKRSLPLLPPKEGIVTSASFKTLFKDEICYQNSAKKIEISSTSEMAKYGLFKGLSHSQVSKFAEEKIEQRCFSLRSGFKEFVSSMSPEQFFIVSVNWSAEFIMSAIGKRFVHFDSIYCNQLLSTDELFTGQFSNQLLTGSDKITFLERILAEQKFSDPDKEFWYIGDSETDILALLHPEVNGVLLIDPEVKEQKLKRLAIEVLGVKKELLDYFISSKSIGWVRCYIKNPNNSFFLAKSWADLAIIRSNHC